MKSNIYKLISFISIIYFLSCSGVSQERDPSTLYALLAAEPATLNPITATDAYSSAIYGRIYENLIDRDDDTLEMKPHLAERWRISSDKMRFRFYLKKGIYWSDGVEFTADDVIYSFNTIKNPKVACGQLKVYYIDVESISKIDKYTVEFKYKRPYFLALEFCGGIPIVPKHIFDDGTDFNSHKNNRFPIGTGPYKFNKWKTGKKIEIIENKNYWGKKPEIKRVVYKFVSEPNVALQMLKKGELDYMSIRTIQWIRQTNSEKFKKNFYKLKYYQPYFNYIGWNGRKEPFNDRRVRQALTHLINREAILEKLLFGLGKTVTGNFYIFSKNYNHKIKKFEYNPVKGEKLLHQAGWTDSNNDGILDRNGKKFKFTFTIASGRKFSERLASIMKEDFSRVGIEMDIVRYEWAVFLGKIHKRNFDAVQVGWSLGYSGDPYQLWHSTQIDEGSNYCYFKNREADSIIERARMEFNESKRINMYHRFHEIIHHEQPYTFLYCTPALAVVSKRFKNVNVHVTGLDFEEWKVK